MEWVYWEKLTPYRVCVCALVLEWTHSKDQVSAVEAARICSSILSLLLVMPDSSTWLSL